MEKRTREEQMEEVAKRVRGILGTVMEAPDAQFALIVLGCTPDGMGDLVTNVDYGDLAWELRQLANKLDRMMAAIREHR